MNSTKATDQEGKDCCWTAGVCTSCHQVGRDLHAVAEVVGTGKVAVAG